MERRRSTLLEPPKRQRTEIGEQRWRSVQDDEGKPRVANSKSTANEGDQRQGGWPDGDGHEKIPGSNPQHLWSLKFLGKGGTLAKEIALSLTALIR